MNDIYLQTYLDMFISKQYLQYNNLLLSYNKTHFDIQFVLNK